MKSILQKLKQLLLLTWLTKTWFSLLIIICYILLLRSTCIVYAESNFFEILKAPNPVALKDDSDCLLIIEQSTYNMTMSNGTEFTISKKTEFDQCFNEVNAPGYWKENELVTDKEVITMTKHVPFPTPKILIRNETDNGNMTAENAAYNQRVTETVDLEQKVAIVPEESPIPKQLKSFGVLIKHKEQLLVHIEDSKTKQLQEYLLFSYVDVFSRLESLLNNNIPVKFPEIRNAVFDCIMENPTNGLWIPNDRADAFDTTASCNRILDMLADDVNNSKDNNSKIVIRVIGTIISTLASASVSEPLDAEFNTKLKAKLFNDMIFNIMCENFDSICNKNK